MFWEIAVFHLLREDVIDFSIKPQQNIIFLNITTKNATVNLDVHTNSLKTHDHFSKRP